MVIETGNQRIIMILSAAIPGQCGLCTFFNRSAHRDERLIYLPPIIAMVNMARGPPFLGGSQCVQKLNAYPGNALYYTD